MESVNMIAVAVVFVSGLVCLIVGLISFGILIAIIAKRSEWLGAVTGGMIAGGICLLIASLPYVIMEAWVRLFSGN